jgi:hypothetical protein
MTMQAAFASVAEGLEVLYRAMEGLHWAAVEGRPQPEDHALVNRLENTASDLMGWIREARQAVEAGHGSCGGAPDLANARQALMDCQARTSQVTWRFFRDVFSVETLHALDSLGREDPARWGEWVRGVEDALGHCPQPLEELYQALFQCWQELTERAGWISVSVTTTTTGQIKLASEKSTAT